ncbi:MAG: hypothetical protein ACKOHM_11685 [Spartobacteria bacterium]
MPEAVWLNPEKRLVDSIQHYFPNRPHDFEVHANEPQNGFALPSTYLGQASYVSLESERPIKMVWQLDHPTPAEMFENCRKGG